MLKKVNYTIAESFHKIENNAAENPMGHMIHCEDIPLPFQSLDKDGNIIYVNSCWLNILGYEKQEVIGEWFGSFLHSDDTEIFNEIFSEFSKSGLVTNIEIRIRKKNQEYLCLGFEGKVSYNTKGEFVQSNCIFKNMTQHKNAESDLKAAIEKAEENARHLLQEKLRFEVMFNTLKEGVIITDKERIIQHANEGMFTTFGYKPVELVGRKTELLYADKVEFEEIGKKISNSNENVSDKNLVRHFKKKKGTIFPCEVFGSKLYDDKGEWIGNLGVMRDISERVKFLNEVETAKDKAKKKEELIKNQKLLVELSNERLESLLRISQYQTNSIQELLDYALSEAIKLTHSKIGYIYFYNEKTMQFSLNTWSKEVMQECKVMNPQTVYDLDKTGCWGEAVRQRKPILINDFEALNPHAKGTTPKGHVKLTKFLTIPVIFDNKIVAVAGVANKETDYDNSDIRQLTLLMDNVWKISERIILIENLKEAKQRAEESDKLKTSFLHNLSHEIRTPMNAITGFSQMLNKEGLSKEKIDSFISIIQSSSNQLLAIVNDVLTISSLETKQEKAVKETADINLILMDLLGEFRPKAAQKSISIHTSAPPFLVEMKIQTDKAKLTQIIQNLIENAIKFTPKGTIEIGYKLVDETPAAKLKFFVKDTGMGINKSMHKKIFDRFCQAEEGLSRTYGGTGLGLSISRGFVELLGGEIWVKSEPGEGSVFYFTVPYVPVNEKSVKLQEKLKSHVSTVLVAEDETYNYLYIQECLSNLGFHTIHAKNGSEAVEKCRKNKSIDLILMDIKMPEMDGATAATIIKKTHPNIPIIAQSAYALEHEVEHYRHIFDDYLVKPIREEKLRQTVMSYVQIQYAKKK